MSTPLPTSTLEADTFRSPRVRPLPNGLREPLLHFLLLGALLFAADHLIVSRADDPHVITVGRDVTAEAVEVFKAARGREPDENELRALHQVWLDNEVLYREGLATQVDKGDTAIRERVIFKELSLIGANLELPPIDDAGLRAWFQQHRDRYDDPARYDFEEALLPGTPGESEVRSFVDQLNGGLPGDAKAGLQVFKRRPLANLVQSYGPEFPASLDAIPPGQWRAIQAKDRWRAIHLTATTPPRPGDYAALRGVVLQDWRDATASERRTAAVRSLAAKYKIRYEKPAP